MFSEPADSNTQQLTDSLLELVRDCDRKLPNTKQIVELLLPPRQERPYTTAEINECLKPVHRGIEQLQRTQNEAFNHIMDSHGRERVKELCKELHDLQLSCMKLHCDIMFVKEQNDAIKTLRQSPLILERQQTLSTERELSLSIQQLKYQPAKLILEQFALHLHDAISICQKIGSPNKLQPFEWAHYHQVILLMSACGRTLESLKHIELLYQSKVDFKAMSTKQSLDQINYNNLIQFPDIYSIELQMEVVMLTGERKVLKEFLASPQVLGIVKQQEPANFELFQSEKYKLEQATIQCCKLLLELNMDYIEAHLTECVNIDRLNGGENASLSPQDEQSLPLYAFSPQESMTKIGQHLLTLKKQTEKFDNADSKFLRRALDFLDQAQDLPIVVATCRNVPDIVMKCISMMCIRSLLGRTSNSVVSRLTANGRRQLATDAQYLDNVLEDLKLFDLSEPNVKKFKKLLAL